jgi:hypothetical protein
MKVSDRFHAVITFTFAPTARLDTADKKAKTPSLLGMEPRAMSYHIVYTCVQITWYLTSLTLHIAVVRWSGHCLAHTGTAR